MIFPAPGAKLSVAGCLGWTRGVFAAGCNCVGDAALQPILLLQPADLNRLVKMLSSKRS